MKMNRKIGLNVFLSNKNIKIEECFDQEKIKDHNGTRIELKKILNAKMYAYVKESDPPIWEDFLKSGLTPIGKTNLDKLLDEERFSISGCLAISVKDRFAIVSFGHGSSLINWKKVVNNFGKKVILSTVDLDRFISIRSSYFERHPRYIESQSSITSNLYEFELDFELQMLGELTGDLEKEMLASGKFEENDIGLRISGSNSLYFSTYRDIEDIYDVLVWFYEKYESVVLNDFFESIDTIEKIEEKHVKDDLFQKLVLQLQDPTNKSFQLIVPGLIDYTEYQTFKIKVEYRTSKTESLDSSAPSIDNLRSQITYSKLKDILNLDHLKNSVSLVCISSVDSTRNKEIPVYKCLTGEVEHDDGERYTLMAGKWFKINQDFYARIVDDLNTLTFTTSNLSCFDPHMDIDKDGKLSETKYNERQKIIQPNSLLLDREKITFRGRGTVEACDLILNDDFYHVKRYSASSTLSHLFFQGSVSTSAILEDKDEYQKKFLKKISELNNSEENRIKELIDSKKFCVVYTILMEESHYHKPIKRIENLPGFSIISLYKAVKDLRRHGVGVRVEILFHKP